MVYMLVLASNLIERGDYIYLNEVTFTFPFSGR